MQKINKNYSYFDFRINEDKYKKGIKHFQKNRLLLAENNFYVLIGCNGCGKSRLISTIAKRCDSRKSEYEEINEKNAFERFNKDVTYYFKYDKSYKTNVTMENASSGEEVINNFSSSISLVSSFVNTHRNCRLLILIDDADFSLSVDYIQNIKDTLKAIIRDCTKNNISYAVLFASNSYEICKDNTYILTHNFKKGKVKKYEDFKELILQSRDYINNEFNKN
jgi:energy-coupling factor transporter ATP-binding protein EcfA2